MIELDILGTGWESPREIVRRWREERERDRRMVVHRVRSRAQLRVWCWRAREMKRAKKEGRAA